MVSSVTMSLTVSPEYGVEVAGVATPPPGEPPLTAAAAGGGPPDYLLRVKETLRCIIGADRLTGRWDAIVPLALSAAVMDLRAGLSVNYKAEDAEGSDDYPDLLVWQATYRSLVLGANLHGIPADGMDRRPELGSLRLFKGGKRVKFRHEV